MRTNDLIKTTSSKLNENMQKTFGKKIKFETFSVEQLEDARNKLRTQVHEMKSKSGFNENLENDTYHQAQWMLDAINAELAEREEPVTEGQDIDDDPMDNIMDNIERNEDLVTESEVEQASAIVTAKTMVDKVSRWIEELSGMENDTLISLGDSIRDEMGSQQAKQFLSTTAPAIEDALSHLKDTRDTMSQALRVLTGDETSTDMLGDEPEDDFETDELDDLEDPAVDDTIDVEDEFAVADPSAGGDEAAGRAKRESVEYSNNLLRVLAG